jgi:hypothetical protein
MWLARLSVCLVSCGGLYIYCLLLEIPRHVGDFGARGAGMEILKAWHVGEFCFVTWHDFTWRGWGYSPSPTPQLGHESTL